MNATIAAAHRAVWSHELKDYVCSMCRVNPADISADIAAEFGTDLPAQWEDCSGEKITARLHIENVYSDGTVREVLTVQIPTPNAEALEEWADDCLFPLTGTGWYGGDGIYIVTVVDSSEKNLTGRTFTWGI
ncbi:hypothetical protein GCM10011584_34440 [Nocardioides phosphati]|uniref:Uncharacterized protein n=1 Tax=Nocardioides phosphati TaxID=1867775 RepID=A0ABQ2NF20_9ACTN|nr:hypothetical protein [Nocardioides phosphati]GGO94124.1 hypothetical protein GCM10011584_34440 [Nocardioides phosphati]